VSAALTPLWELIGAHQRQIREEEPVAIAALVVSDPTHVTTDADGSGAFTYVSDEAGEATVYIVHPQQRPEGSMGVADGDTMLEVRLGGDVGVTRVWRAPSEVAEVAGHAHERVASRRPTAARVDECAQGSSELVR